MRVCGITDDAENIGDVLRQVVDLKVIKDDFLVVRGDVITNIDIHGALQMHYHIKQEENKKHNQAQDSRKFKTIMTKLFIKMPYSNPLKDPWNEITLMLDSQIKEIYKY